MKKCPHTTDLLYNNKRIIGRLNQYFSMYLEIQKTVNNRGGLPSLLKFLYSLTIITKDKILVKERQRVTIFSDNF